ncbi:hypothetical protein [Nocardia sp. NPDC050435]|uniref:LtfC-like domain-containing protein n=1 Tax=Nocardia sp. NPDC050435 TaxID=3155040 RepID=UPI0033C09F05
MPIGRQPLRDKLILTLGADLVHTIKLPNGRTFPSGTTAVIRFYPPGKTNTLVSIAEFPAIVFPDRAEWRVESELADPVPDRAHYRIYVSYPETPRLDHCWVIGDVSRQQ